MIEQVSVNGREDTGKSSEFFWGGQICMSCHCWRVQEFTKPWTSGLASHIFYFTFSSSSPPSSSLSPHPSPVSPFLPFAILWLSLERHRYQRHGSQVSTSLAHMLVAFIPRGECFFHVLHRVKLKAYPFLVARTLNTEANSTLPENPSSLRLKHQWQLHWLVTALWALGLRSTTHVSLVM